MVNNAKAMQSCFPVTGPTSHSKKTRPPGFFFFPETKVERKWCANSIMCEVWGQDYKMQTLVCPRSQNIEPWMVKPLSTACVNTVVAC